MATFNKVLAAVILQEYAKVANNTKRKVLVIAYQGLENHYRLINIAIKARRAVDKV